MRKYLLMFLVLCALCALMAGCAASGASETETAISSTTQTPDMDVIPEVTARIDIDLTALSSTMVYAEVYNMMEVPKDFIGKTIKMIGPYYASYYDETEKYYHFVIIEDAAACCQSGLEFIWNGEHTYPDDYPEENAKVEVVGVFGSYEELGQTYYYLAVDEISVLE